MQQPLACSHLHKTSISFTHRIIEYLNSIAPRYVLAVSSRKTAVKLVTRLLSFREPPSCEIPHSLWNSHPKIPPAVPLLSSLRIKQRSSPMGALGKWFKNIFLQEGGGGNLTEIQLFQRKTHEKKHAWFTYYNTIITIL